MSEVRSVRVVWEDIRVEMELRAIYYTWGLVSLGILLDFNLHVS